MSQKMSKSKPKNYRRDWLKERNQHEWWKNKYKELEATIKGEALPSKMAAVTEEQAQHFEVTNKLKSSIVNLVDQIDALKKELKACQEECRLKDEEIESLKDALGLCLKSNPLKAEDRQVADPEAAAEVEEGGEPDDGLSGGVEESKDEEEEEEQEEEQEAEEEEEEQEAEKEEEEEEEGAESKDEEAEEEEAGEDNNVLYPVELRF